MPMYLLFRLTILIGSRYCLQVESSCRHIWIEDSPVTQATVAPGLASCARLAAGDLVELHQHVLRLDDLRLAVVSQAVPGAPWLDLLPPGLERRRLRPP